MLTLNELRRMVKKHNQLMDIIIPPKTNRDGLIKLIEKNGFTIDHDKKKIIPKIQMKRKPTVPLPPAPPKKTEAEKKMAKQKRMERESKRDKVGYDKELKKRVEAVKKARASKPKPKPAPTPAPKPKPVKKKSPAKKPEPFVLIKSGETSYDIPASNKKTKSLTELKQAYNKLGMEVFTWKTEADKKKIREDLKKSGRKEVVGKIPYIDPISQMGSDPRGGSYGGAKPKPKPVKPGSKGVKVWTGSGTLPDGTTTKNDVLFESRWRPLGWKITNLKPSKTGDTMEVTASVPETIPGKSGQYQIDMNRIIGKKNITQINQYLKSKGFGDLSGTALSFFNKHVGKKGWGAHIKIRMEGGQTVKRKKTEQPPFKEGVIDFTLRQRGQPKEGSMFNLKYIK